MVHNLSEKQKTIFQIIKNTMENFGIAPTVRELMNEIGAKSPRTISHHLKSLEKKGFINRTGENKRNIIIVASDENNPMANLIRVPLVGWTAGGEAIFSEENILEWIPISSRFFRLPSDEIFLLKVKGHSMAPKIENSDLIIVRKQYTAEVGQTIVALIGDQTTVKKYIPREDHIVLQPINPDYEPIVVFPDELRIQGIVQGILKYYQ
jgi:repressor LexA